MPAATSALLLSLVAGAATVLGLLLVMHCESRVRRTSIFFVSVAAGMLLATGLLGLLPEALALNPSAPLWVLLGMGIFYIVESFVTIHACTEETCVEHKLGILSTLGIGLHSLFDGLAIAVGFEVDARLGLLTAIAVILHELPEGVFTSSLLLHAGFPRRNVILATLAVAVATPAGALLALAFAPRLTAGGVGGLLGLVCGSFLYVAASDLVPETHRHRTKWTLAFFALGVLITMALLRLE